MQYRPLSEAEMAHLRANGCRAEDWRRIEVVDGFRSDRVARCDFSGSVRLGRFDGEVAGRASGLYDSVLHNAWVGDGALVSRVGYLANYEVAEGALISNVGRIAVEGSTTFGNGLQLAVLNEAGGRELAIYDRLTAQIAYLMVMYRHVPAMVDRLREMVRDYAESCRSDRGRVGRGARIENTGGVIDVMVGDWAQVSGAAELREGTVAGSRLDPVRVGAGVAAREFIIQSGSWVESGAVLERCFVGQGVRLGKSFSSENSAFFANCEGFHGETCSVFAGPYTVTHHKSTLLIAAMFSFFNAGSGTNQSNHMYKLGPVHQGVAMRGAKTGSYSYILWPSVVGPFSVVVGRHTTNFDLGDLPFSYILAEGDETAVVPARNLFTVGTRRDAEKWPARDRRKGEEKLDLLRFDLWSPYVMSKVIRAIGALRELDVQTPADRNVIRYKGAHMSRHALHLGIRYYEMARSIFLGDCLMAMLEESGGDAGLVAARLAAMGPVHPDRWVDMAGMLAPARAVDGLAADLASGAVADLDAMSARLKAIHEAYDEAKRSWFAGLLMEHLGVDGGGISADRMIGVLEEGIAAHEKLNSDVLRDAEKEFGPSARIGFGIDGDAETRAADFEAVRGFCEDNRFVRSVREESAVFRIKADAAIALLSR